MGFGLRSLYIFILISIVASKAESASFHKLQRKLLDRSRQGLPADDIIISDVKEWVSSTINRLSNRVEFIGYEIEKAVYRQTVLDHNQLLSDGVSTGNLQLSDLHRESPAYSVLCASTNGYEARLYERALWVLTFGNPGEDFTTAKLRCESKIKQYILGHNERGIKIKVTSPWLSMVSSSNEGESKQYSFLFYLPTTMQEDPPPPEDPTIFFEYMSPKVFAFSYSNEANEDAAWTLMQDVTFQLAQSQERFNTNQYYLADYEAPFYKMSTNNEILIPMNDSYIPHCGDIRPKEASSPLTTPVPTTRRHASRKEDMGEPCSDCSDEPTSTEVTQTESPSAEAIHLQLMKRAQYLYTTTNICSAEVLDISIMELVLNYQAALANISGLSRTPQNVLLWIRRTDIHDAETCDQVSVEVLLELPMQFQLESNLKGNISVKTLPATLIYTKPFGRDNPAPSLLDTVFPEYFNLQERLLEENLCFAEKDFFINANLESPSPSSSQVWIPYSSKCWKNSAFLSDIDQENTRADNGVATKKEAEDEEESSGSFALVVDEFR